MAAMPFHQLITVNGNELHLMILGTPANTVWDSVPSTGSDAIPIFCQHFTKHFFVLKPK